ncbi:stalk domain-containing protein [Paenibacillus sp. GCM10023252]|uniref:stalk domain-containing protein n=1 Tax=Paenibacillus sp. GCM10023252 TaxID=3252649 RepID=UPI00361A18C9
MPTKFRKSIFRGAAILISAAVMSAAFSPVGGMLAVNQQGPAAYAAEAAPSQDGVYRIVAIGDSLTAGYEYGMENESNPIPYGYVEHVYEQALYQGLRTEYVNYGVIGLTTDGLASFLEAAADGKPLDPSKVVSKDPRAKQILGQSAQLAADLKQADLVLLTVGANDVLPIFNLVTKKEEDAAEQQENLEQGKQDLQGVLHNYEQKLMQSLRTITSLQPNIHIVTSNQYLPVPETIQVANSTIPVFSNPQIYPFLVEAADELQVHLDSAVSGLENEGVHLDVVNMREAFRGKELLYINFKKGDIHPNAKGYGIMGKAFAETIWGAYRAAALPKPPAPINVIVGGKELITPYKPVIKEGRTFVAMRDITDALGAKLTWNQKSKTAVVISGTSKIEITIGASTIKVNGTAVKLKTPPAYLQRIGSENKTYLPLLAISEGLGYQVVYRDKMKTAFINK